MEGRICSTCSRLRTENRAPGLLMMRSTTAKISRIAPDSGGVCSILSNCASTVPPQLRKDDRSGGAEGWWG